MFCKYCGYEIKDGGGFCPNCGNVLEAVNDNMVNNNTYNNGLNGTGYNNNLNNYNNVNYGNNINDSNYYNNADLNAGNKGNKKSSGIIIAAIIAFVVLVAAAIIVFVVINNKKKDSEDNQDKKSVEANLDDFDKNGDKNQEQSGLGEKQDNHVGTYKLDSMAGTSVVELQNAYDEAGMNVDISNMFIIELKSDNTFTIKYDTDSQSGTYTIDGEKIALTIDNETEEGTIKDGVLTIGEGNERMVFKK